jgi:hypothetical protein
MYTCETCPLNPQKDDDQSCSYMPPDSRECMETRAEIDNGPMKARGEADHDLRVASLLGELSTDDDTLT